jgi:hypothetical protein
MMPLPEPFQLIARQLRSVSGKTVNLILPA